MYKASDTPELQCIRERIEAMWAEGVDWLTNPPQIFVRNEEIPVDVLGLEDPSQSGSAVTPDPILTAESFVPQPPFEWPQGESRLFSALPMPPIEEYMSPPSDPPFPSVLDPRETVTGSDHEEADAA
jgi:hypothetical protein